MSFIPARPSERGTLRSGASGCGLARLASQIVDACRSESDVGGVASYIPQLALVDSRQFGIAIVTADGEMAVGGDCCTPFTLQSVSKVFSLTLALAKVGDQLWSRVGREPSGSRFNSIIQLEEEGGIPRNPFINAGALVVADVNLGTHEPEEVSGEFVRFVQLVAGDKSIGVDEAVANSERETSHRNAALASYMRSFGNLDNPVERLLGTYCHQCATSMNCLQLAQAGRYLMLDGGIPSVGRVISPLRAKRILALMLTCGLYDASGDFAFRIGIPAKSGVSGAILAIVPGVASIAVWSPGLDRFGNSKLGIQAIERIADATGWSVFSAP